MAFTTLVYKTDGPIATITLNRPNELNTIVPPMPEEFEQAINLAVKDTSVKVIILRGAGRSFCAGYDFGDGFHLWDEHITTNGAWDAGKDFAWSTAQALAPTRNPASYFDFPRSGWGTSPEEKKSVIGERGAVSRDAKRSLPDRNLCHSPNTSGLSRDARQESLFQLRLPIAGPASSVSLSVRDSNRFAFIKKSRAKQVSGTPACVSARLPSAFGWQE